MTPELDIVLGRYHADDWARRNSKSKELRMRHKATLLERAKSAPRPIHIFGHQGVILFTAYPPPYVAAARRMFGMT